MRLPKNYMNSNFYLFVCLCCKLVATISDLNDAELQYLSNHLSISECRHLVASLCIESYEFPEEAALITAANKLSQESSCLELLKKWNREFGNETSHMLFTRRLNQIQRDDLSIWLSETVFQGVAKSIADSIKSEIADENVDSTESGLIWTESFIEIEEPDADNDLIDYSDDNDNDDDEIALDALLMSGGAAGLVWFIYQIVKMILTRRNN